MPLCCWAVRRLDRFILPCCNVIILGVYRGLGEIPQCVWDIPPLKNLFDWTSFLINVNSSSLNSVRANNDLSELTILAPCPSTSGLQGAPGGQSMLGAMHTDKLKLVIWFSWAFPMMPCSTASRWRSSRTFPLGSRQIILPEVGSSS